MSNKVTFELLWQEFVFKSVNLILNHRINIPVVKHKKDKASWFQIKLQETENVNNLLQRLFASFNNSSNNNNNTSGGGGGASQPKNIYIDIYAEETTGSSKKHLLERWCIEVTDKTKDAPLSEKQQEDLNYHLRSAYRKSIVLIRSLFSYILLLPSYSVYQKLQKHRTGLGYTLNFTISSTETSPNESTYLRTVDFSSIEAAPFCKMKISVKYRKQKLSELLTTNEQSVLRESQIDADYFSDNRNDQPSLDNQQRGAKKRTQSIAHNMHVNFDEKSTPGGGEPSSYKEKVVPPLEFDRKRTYSMPPKKNPSSNPLLLNNSEDNDGPTVNTHTTTSSSLSSKPMNIPLTFERQKPKFLPTETPPFSNPILGASPATGGGTSIPRQNSALNLNLAYQSSVSPPFGSFGEIKFSPMGYNPPSMLSESFNKQSPNSMMNQFERIDTIPSLFTGNGFQDMPRSLDQHKVIDFMPNLLEGLDSSDDEDDDHQESVMDDDFPFIGSVDDMNMLQESDGLDDDELVGSLLNSLNRAPKRLSESKPISIDELNKQFNDLRQYLQDLNNQK